MFDISWIPTSPGPGGDRCERVLIVAGNEVLAEALRWASEREGILAAVASWADGALDDELRIDELIRARPYDEIWLTVGRPQLRGRSLSPADLDTLVRRGPGALAACARSLAALARGRRTRGRTLPRLRVLSVGACAAERAPSLDGALQAPVWGLARAIRAEHPELELTLVALDPNADLDGVALAYVAMLGKGLGDEPELALRGGRCLVPRLEPAPALDGRVELNPETAYLVVGGLGPLGSELVRGLVERGARRLVLAGLRVAVDDDERRRAFVAELERAGVSVELVRVDIRDRAALVALRRERAAAGRPAIGGVVLGAMSEDAGVLASLDPRDIGDRMALELGGSWNLQAVFGGLELFLACTSASSLISALAHGHGCQAAGQAFIHGLAASMRAQGTAAAAVAFGPWRELASQSMVRASLSVGFGPVGRAEAARAIDTALLGARSELACVEIDPETIATVASDEAPPLLARLLSTSQGARAPRSLVTLTPGEGRPLFVVHPLDGELGCYAPIVARLGTTRPIVGLCSPALSDAGVPSEDLVELAADYHRRARARQARGPLDLLGWGFGGALALELGRRELVEGRELGLVALIDTPVPTRRSTSAELDEQLDTIVAFLAELGRLEPGDRRNLATRAELDPIAPSCRVDLAHRLARETKLISASLERGHFARRVEVFGAHRRALARWRPRTLDASVDYFAPAGARALARAQAWLPRVAELTIHRVPAERSEIMSGSGAAAIAEVLRGRLRSSRRPASEGLVSQR